jgi:tRNA modification GTPase
MAVQRDTIVAAATPPGRGGVAVVRVSGEGAPAIARALLGDVPAPRHARFCCWHQEDGELIDAGLALFFAAPQSYTGEHVLELQSHGSDIAVAALIERIVALGARHARPGEFTERAFLNDKIDLTQAEGIADLINAGSKRAAQAALRSMQGEFSSRVRSVGAALTGLRVYVEAAIDFPEEEIDFLGSQEVRERLADVQARLTAVLHAAQQGVVLTQGLSIAIAGRPNAGKSTLMNALAGQDVAIVTPVAGTTRDLLRARVQIDGITMELTDTAGLREGSATAEGEQLTDHDAIEAEGMRRARAAIARADHILFVVDAAEDPRAQSFSAELPGLPVDVPVTVVMNKSDLRKKKTNGAAKLPPGATAMLGISATTGAGLDQLRTHLALLAGGAGADGGAFSARQHHVDSLRRAAVRLDAASAQLAAKQGELAALELREAQRELGEIVGDVTSDELLGRIFSSFCIGK